MTEKLGAFHFGLSYFLIHSLIFHSRSFSFPYDAFFSMLSFFALFISPFFFFAMAGCHLSTLLLLLLSLSSSSSSSISRHCLLVLININVAVVASHVICILTHIFDVLIIYLFMYVFFAFVVVVARLFFQFY